MKQFVATYTKKYGEYNDESNTKCYALEYIIDTIKADPKAIEDVAEFQKEMETFSAPNPFVKTAGSTLQYIGTTSFGQKRQISVPMVVNQYENGGFKTLFVGSVD
jgi:branched-chain amino acid transport system substrate-binding protein